MDVSNPFACIEDARDSVLYGRQLRFTDRIQNYFQIGVELGRGYTSIVYSARNKKDHRECALKEVGKVRQSLIANEQYYRDLLEEIIRLKNPYVCEIHSIWETPDAFYIEMDKCTGMDLVDFVLSYHPDKIPNHIIKRLMLQLFVGLSTVHRSHLIHRDIKLDNVMFKDNYSLDISIYDFDMAKMLTRRDEPKLFLRPNQVSIVGTREYMAPETFSGKYHYSTDIWACGVVLYVLLNGHFPFETKKAKSTEVLKVLQSGCTIPAKLRKSNPMPVDLLDRLLVYKASGRMASIDECLAHPWFNPIYRNVSRNKENEIPTKQRSEKSKVYETPISVDDDDSANPNQYTCRTPQMCGLLDRMVGTPPTVASNMELPTWPQEYDHEKVHIVVRNLGKSGSDPKKLNIVTARANTTQNIGYPTRINGSDSVTLPVFPVL